MSRTSAQRWCVFLGLLAWLSSLWQGFPQGPVRVLGLVLLVAAVGIGRRNSNPSYIAIRIFGPIAVVAIASCTWTHDLNRTYEALVALGLGVASVWCVLTVGPASRGWALRRILVTVLIATLVVEGPGLLGSRISGPFVNPNALGATLVLLIPHAWVASARIGRLSVWPAVGLAALTGSRATGFAVLAQLLYMVLSNRDSILLRRVGSRIVVVSALAGGVALLITGIGTEAILSTNTYEESVGLLRSGNSRYETWTDTTQQIRDHTLLGLGYGVEKAFSASSALAVLQQLGLVGMAALIVSLGRLVRRVAWEDRTRFAVLLGGLCNALFESWLIAGGSALFLLFWVSALPCQRRASPLSPHRLDERSIALTRSPPG